jgi:hypothetical protein
MAPASAVNVPGAALRAHADLVLAPLTLLALFARVLCTPEPFFGAGTDIATIDYPLTTFATEWIRRGVVPMWNPYLFTGLPFPAGIHGYFYPGWATGLLSAVAAVKVTLALHLALAALGATWFCRGRVESRLASYLGGVVFAASGFWIAHLFAGHRGVVATAAYAPWIVGFVDRVQSGAKVSWAGGVVIFGLAFLSAHYQMLAIAFLGAILLVLGRALFSSAPRRDRVRASGRALAALAALAFAGALLAALQLVPLAASLGGSQRAATDADFAATPASVPGDLLALLFPNVVGNGADVPFVGDFVYHEAFQYLGAVTLVLIALAVTARPRADWAPALLGACVAWLLALGNATPLLRILFALAPPFARFRAPGRFVVLVSLFGALLAAQGLDAFLSRQGRASRATQVGVAAVAFAALSLALVAVLAPDETLIHGIAAVLPVASDVPREIWAKVLGEARTDGLVHGALIVAAAALVLVPSRRRELVGAALVAGCVLDLVGFAQRFLIVRPVQAIEWPAGLVEACRSASGVAGRVLTTPELRAPDLPAAYALPSVTGYETFMDGRFARLVNFAEGAPPDRFVSFVKSAGDARILRHLGASVVVSSLPIADPAGHARLAIGDFHRIGRAGRLQVFAADAPVPRVAITHAVAVVGSDDEALARMDDPAFDLRKETLLSAAPTGWRVESAPPEAMEKAAIVRYEPNVVELHAEAASPGLLVLSDAYREGWSAEVDGATIPMISANVVMRAVPVAAGTHVVVMRYAPPGFRLGVALSLAFGLLSAGAAVARRRLVKRERS